MNLLSLETAIINLEATVRTFEVVVNFANDPGADRHTSAASLNTIERMLNADAMALQKVFEELSEARKAMKGGA